tara:strand:- start:870 stop:1187 length:318 start_codon:yes stop_codon:yes gene_type:complete
MNTFFINKFIELAGVILFSITLSPQIIKVISTKKVNDLSLSFLVLNIFSSLLLGYSAIINNNTQFVIVNTVAIIQTVILLFLKNYYERDIDYQFIPDRVPLTQSL